MESQTGTRSRIADLKKRAELGQLPAAKSLEAPISAGSSSGKWKSRATFSAGEADDEYSSPDTESLEAPPSQLAPSPERNSSTAEHRAPEVPLKNDALPMSRSARFSANAANTPVNSLASTNASRIADMAAKFAGRAPTDRATSPASPVDGNAHRPERHTESIQTGVDDSVHEDRLLPWDNENIPAGSGFTEEEWLAAEAMEPGGFVFEVLTGDERGLVHYPREKMNIIHTTVLQRSLIVLAKHKDKTPFFNEACVTIHHKTEDMGVFTYKAIIARARLKTDGWIRGSVLHNWIVEDTQKSQRSQTPAQSSQRQSYTKPAPPPDSRAARFRSGN